MRYDSRKYLQRRVFNLTFCQFMGWSMFLYLSQKAGNLRSDVMFQSE
jgi:hypothetical protein